ncbi:hypothetical protein [Streptomyces sp. NPDC088746]|uniref:hypothetical protein n=1 Tax=Streptomyces sp. NPDC088746 TaxID=3365885 RepID=UPI0038109C2D
MARRGQLHARRYGTLRNDLGGRGVLAGVLRSLPALTAIACSTPASYLRLAPSAWAGVYRCWGWENREAAPRFVTKTVGTASHCANAELKCFDQADNP